MPFKNEDWQPTREEAMAEHLDGLYGDEYAESLDQLADLENGIRKHWAEKLREEASDWDGWPLKANTLMWAADLLDPYSEHDGDNGEFARTTTEEL